MPELITIAGLVAAVVKAVSAHAGSSGDGLLHSLGSEVGSASGDEIAKRINKYFKKDERSDALEGAVQTAAQRTTDAHPDFMRDVGGFPSQFAEHEAASEIAKLFVTGLEPDARALTTKWMTSLGPTAALKVELVVGAVDVCETFLAEIE